MWDRHLVKDMWGRHLVKDMWDRHLVKDMWDRHGRKRHRRTSEIDNGLQTGVCTDKCIGMFPHKSTDGVHHGQSICLFPFLILGGKPIVP